MEEYRQRHTRVVPIFIKSENIESVVVHHSHFAPKGKQFRLPKRKDKKGVYVFFKCRKVYEENWIRVDSQSIQAVR